LTVQASGHYFPPDSAHTVEAVAERTEDGRLCVRDAQGGVLAEAPARLVETSTRLGKLRRKLNFPGQGCFETADNDAVDTMLLGGAGLLHRLEKSWRAVLASVLVAGAAAAWFVIYGVPATAGFLAGHTPDSAAHFITSQALGVLDDRSLRPSRLDPARRKAFQGYFDAVAAHQQKRAGSYRLLLRDAPLIGPNAFALPDGSIVLTDQLTAMIESKDEIQGVFAHEMAHVNRAHVLQQIYQAALVPAAIAFISGDASQASHFGAILPGILLQSSYSRAFEQQADDDAAATMRAMGDDPARLAGLLERMEQRMCGGHDCGPSWLGSHPATAERAARLRQEAGNKAVGTAAASR
jgi:Zn-dependent protease with chaperone function